MLPVQSVATITFKMTSWIHTVLSYLCVAFLAVAALLFLYPLHVNLPYFDTDFVDYCVAAATFEDSERFFPPKRTRIAALLSWFGTHFFGVFRGIAVASAFSFVASALLLFHWGRTYSSFIAWLSLEKLSLAPREIEAHVQSKQK